MVLVRRITRGETCCLEQGGRDISGLAGGRSGSADTALVWRGRDIERRTAGELAERWWSGGGPCDETARAETAFLARGSNGGRSTRLSLFPRSLETPGTASNAACGAGWGLLFIIDRLGCCIEMTGPSQLIMTCLQLLQCTVVDHHACAMHNSTTTHQMYRGWHKLIHKCHPALTFFNKYTTINLAGITSATLRTKSLK